MSGACTYGKPGQKDPHTHVPYVPISQRPYGILPDALHAIGATPMVRLTRLMKAEGLEGKVELLGKCEFFNTGGSIKDRIGWRMVEDAEKSGRLKKGDTLIEPTSGNTGIGLALAAAIKGYRCIITLPEKMSQEKVDVLKALGAEIIRTPTEAAWDSPESHIGVAKRLNKEIANSHILDQYANPGNPLAHYDGTAEEILEQCDKKIDYVVMTAGTGGTITGVARKLKEVVPTCKIVGVDPHGSILAQPETLNAEGIHSYKVEGIGYDFIPNVLDRSLVDIWLKSRDPESFVMSRRLIREEGLLCGGSCGSAVVAALEVAKTAPAGARIVVILPDSTRNYMTKFLSDDWMNTNGFVDERVVALQKVEQEKWGGATVRDLNLPDAVTIRPTTTCREAVDILNKKGFDTLPVTDEKGQVVGIVTEGNLLSKITRKLVLPTSPVSEMMLKFQRKSKFQPITVDTKIADLSRFFEKHSIAWVTDVPAAGASPTVKHVVAKIDLINYLLKKEKDAKKP